MLSNVCENSKPSMFGASTLSTSRPPAFFGGLFSRITYSRLRVRLSVDKRHGAVVWSTLVFTAGRWPFLFLSVAVGAGLNTGRRYVGVLGL